MKTRYDKLAVWKNRENNSTWYIFRTDRRAGIGRIHLTDGIYKKVTVSGELRREFKHIGYTDCIPTINLDRSDSEENKSKS